MRTNKYLSASKLSYITAFMLLMLVTTSIIILSGCSASQDVVEEDSPPVQESANEVQEINEPVDHNVDMNPAPLEDSDKDLSLEGYGAIGALADSYLTINDMLMYAVQDEYLARGEYLAIMDKFGSQRPYSNIATSEERHLEYLKEVYHSYGLDFPEDTSDGHVIIPDSLLQAAQTGVQAEIDNIAMYELFLSYELPDNVYDVFLALMKGSESHLLAFEKQVNRLQ